MLAVDAHDLAFGTSRWSSKLVHGGLRYLASGQVGVAHESAVERGILMEVTAPHLTHAMPTLMPLNDAVSRRQAAVIARRRLLGGDLLRRGARTSTDTLPRPRHLSATEALADGAAAAHGRAARRRCSAGTASSRTTPGWSPRWRAPRRRTAPTSAPAPGCSSATGTAVSLRDELTGAALEVTARTVINATGVWAGDLVDEVKLRPSRGTHLVLREPIDARTSRPPSSRRCRARPTGSCWCCPSPTARSYVGLTDEPADGPVPDVPEPTEPEIGFLLDVVAAAFEQPLHRSDVVGAFAGLRPLLDVPGLAATSRDRRHLPQARRRCVSRTRRGHDRGRQADDVPPDGRGRRRRGRSRTPGSTPASAGPARCRCSAPPTGSRAGRARAAAPGWSGGSAPTPGWSSRPRARATGLTDDELLAPIADGIPVTLAELVFGVTHEGAADVDDLLDRRTRVGLIPADRALAVPAAERALALAAAAARHM